MESSHYHGIYLSVIFSILMMPYDTRNTVNGHLISTSDTSKQQIQSLLQRIFKEKQSLSTLQAALATSLADKKYQTFYNNDDDEDNMINKPFIGNIKNQASAPMYSGEYDSTYHTSGGYTYEDKRSSEEQEDTNNNKAVVDILVVVDNTIYQYYLKKHNNGHKKAIRSIKRYYTLLINLIDSRFREVNLVVPLRIRPASIEILEDKSVDWSPSDFHDWKNEAGAREAVLEPHRALKDLQQWLVINKNGLPPYDHAMAFTGHKLVKENHLHPSSGMAYISTICQTDYGYSSSIIGEIKGFANVETASHELGHSLGARHDGKTPNENCPSDLGYIMAPSVSLRENYEHNYFTFSPCSIKAFNDMLRSDQASCLFNSKPVSSPNKLPGQWLSPDKQCKHVFGYSSGECRMSGSQKGEEICQMLWCRDPHDKYSCITKSGLHAVYGTPCSKGKMCYNGKCVEEDSIGSYNKGSSKSYDKGNRKTVYPNHEEKSTETRYNNHFRDIPFRDSEESFEGVEPGNEIIDIDSNKAFDNSGESNPTLGEMQINSLSMIKNPTNKARQRQNARHRSTRKSTTIAPSTVPSTETTRKTTTPTKATTRKPTTIKDSATLCKGDGNQRYCRNLVYTNGQQACSVPHIASYCCYSCSFYGH